MHKFFITVILLLALVGCPIIQQAQSQANIDDTTTEKWKLKCYDLNEEVVGDEIQYKLINLDKEIVNCTALTMDLTITEYTGYPFGNWYLYAKDLNDRWDHIDNFRIEKEQGNGSTRTYEFHFDSPQSFKALAICMRDKGNEYSMNSSENFYVNS